MSDGRQYTGPSAQLDARRELSWLRRLLPVALADKPVWVAAALAALAGLFGSVAGPYVLGVAINDALGTSSTTNRPLLHYLGALLVIGVLRAVGQGGYRYALYRVGYRLETDLRALVYQHLTRLSFSFFDRVQTGQIISRANSDIRSVQTFLTIAPLMAVACMSFVLALGFMLSTHVGLTLASLVALPFVYLIGKRMRRTNFPLSFIVQARQAELASVVDESIQGVRVVKSFAAEPRQIGRLAHAAQRLQWAASEMAIVRARFGPMMENVARISPALLLLYGGMLVIDGSLDGVGTLVTFNTYLMMLQAPFRVLGFFLSVSQRAEASAQRIFELLDEPIAVAERPDARALPEGAGRVELRDVTFGYGDGEAVLRELALEAMPGETIAIVGRSGSGKSTIARLLLRFYDVRAGVIAIDGADIAGATLQSVRDTVGYVPEEPFLFSASVHDNIAFGKPDATRQEVAAAARDAMADDFVQALPEGYDTRVGERGYTLSGGQRQRIALARVLLTNPRILVLDDATSSVDAVTEAAIHRALHARRKDRTTLLIAHRESTIRLADRVVLIEDGRAVATGAHEALLVHEPRYARVLASAERVKPLENPSYAAAIDALAAKSDPSAMGGLGG